MVFKAFNNDNPEHVLSKVAVLNILYSARLNNTQNEDDKMVDVLSMANYIGNNKEFFNNTSHSETDVIEWVDKARTHFKSEGKNSPYSFLTKYCAWSFPTLNIPIVDSYTKAMLYYINEFYPYFSRKFYRYEINNEKDGFDVKYSFFCEVFAKFKEVHAQNFNYKEIDKYLWYYGKHGKEGVNKPIQF